MKTLVAKPSLKDIERKILEVMELNRSYSLREIHELLQQQGVKKTKQYIHKILKQLEEEGYIIRIGRGRYAKRLH